MPKVSIIIPAYNVEKYIEKCLNSAINQSEKDIEIVVVDDGSSDTTGMLIARMAEKDKRIIFIPQKNTGVSGARNNAIKHTTGEYLLFLDSDDWLEHNAVEELLNALPDGKDVLVCSECYFVEYEDDVLLRNQQGINNAKYYIGREEALLKAGRATQYKLQSSCYKLFKREVVIENNIQFEKSVHYGEDGLFAFEYLLNMDGIVYIPTPLWNILDRPGSATKAHYNPKMITSLTAVDKMLEAGRCYITNKVIDNLRAQKAERAIWILNKYLLADRDNKSEYLIAQTALKENWRYLVRRNKTVKTLVQCVLMQTFPENVLKPLIKAKDRRKN